MSEEEDVYKINISAGKGSPDKYKGMTRTIRLEEDKFTLVGKKIGESFNGSIIGLSGFTLKITGGSNDAGIPMRFDIDGPVKKKVLLKKGPCYNPTKIKKKSRTRSRARNPNGTRKRKVVVGNEITYDTVQVNCVIEKFGKDDSLFAMVADVGGDN
jgi:small subunit ribosomal protein S6e